METVWVFGDQLNRAIGALRNTSPSTHRVLLIESRAKLASRHWHVQRAHFLITSMRRFAERAAIRGIRRRLPLRGDVRRRIPCARRAVLADPRGRDRTEQLRRPRTRRRASASRPCDPISSSVITPNLREWADTRKSLRLEDFYRHQRTRLGYLMDGDEPAGGRWNYDAENRKPPPATVAAVAGATPSRSSTTSTGRCSPICRAGAGAITRRHVGDLACRGAASADPLRRPTSSRCSAPTKTRCSPTTGTSPTRCCRPT